jgi:sarcosine oxidase, subunit alpha
MSGKPYRLPESAGAGRLIDRSKPLGFTFDGRRMTGFAGDTLASAVLANGQALFGRSFKYHRPRGLVGLGLGGAQCAGRRGRESPARAEPARHAGRVA